MQLNMQIERNVVSDVDASLFCGICAFVYICLRVFRYFNHIISMHPLATKHTYTETMQCNVQNKCTAVNNFHLTLRLKLTHRIRAPKYTAQSYFRYKIGVAFRCQSMHLLSDCLVGWLMHFYLTIYFLHSFST